MDNNFQLSELETDLLAELFNIGVGKAADSLSKMVNHEVKLSVPSVEFKTIMAMADYLGGDMEICSVSQEMRGSFDARSMLLFHEESSMEVVRQLMGSHLSDEMVADMQEEALNEIGNIVLNACIGAIGSSLNQDFEVGLPVFQQGKPLNLLKPSMPLENDSILLIRIHMELKDCAVKGYLAFLLGQTSQENLQNNLKSMLDKFS